VVHSGQKKSQMPQKKSHGRWIAKSVGKNVSIFGLLPNFNKYIRNPAKIDNVKI
jgi:hypothetical protein